MAYAAAIMLVAGAISTYMQAQAQAEAQNAQAKAARMEAQYARAAAEVEAKNQEQTAQAALASGRARRGQVEAASARLLNAQAAKAGGAGVVAGEGSLLVTQLESGALAEYTAQSEEYPYRLESKRLYAQAEQARYSGALQGNLKDFESSLFKYGAKSTMYYGTIATGLALLGAGSSAYQTYQGRQGGGVNTYYSGSAHTGGGGAGSSYSGAGYD